MSRTLRGTVNLLLLSSICLGGSQVIGPQAVWRPSTEFIRTIMQSCGNREAAELHACFLREMQASGASAEALAFSGQLYATTKGLIGFLREFRETGPVDLAYVEYVFRANENLACYLVNGKPPMIDVDDSKILPSDALESNRKYRVIKARYFKVSIWPSDRSMTDHPIVKKLPDSGERFIANYWLQNGCHACERIGSAQFAFDFDQSGRFLGSHLLAVEPGAGAAGEDQRHYLSKGLIARNHLPNDSSLAKVSRARLKLSGPTFTEP